MIEYKIKESSEEESKVVIEKVGQVYEFSVGQVRQNLEELKKKRKEFEGQREIENAKMFNIREHNPVLNDLSEAQIHAVHMYFEAFAIAKVCEKQIAEHNEVIGEIEGELVEIKNQIGITI